MNPGDITNTEPTLPGILEPTPMGTALLLTGAANGCWHAVTPDPPSTARTDPTRTDPVIGQPSAGTSVCGLWVRLARSHGVFDRTRWGHSVCPGCAWALAARAGVGAVGVEAALWTDPATGPLGRLTVRVAVAIARICQDRDELDDPVTVRLLTAVGTHAPLALYAGSCRDGACDHTPAVEEEVDQVRPGPRCPVSAVVCPACSLRSRLARDEDGGGFLDECTIPAPCQVLAMIAVCFGVTVPVARGVGR